MLAGCSSGLNDPTFATGSSTVVSSERGDAVFAVNPDEGTLSRLTTDGKTVLTAKVGGEPTRLARMGNQLLVSLRTDRSITLVDAKTLEI